MCPPTGSASEGGHRAPAAAGGAAALGAAQREVHSPGRSPAIPTFPAMCQAACCSVAAPPAGIVSNLFFCPSFFTSEEP